MAQVGKNSHIAVRATRNEDFAGRRPVVASPDREAGLCKPEEKSVDRFSRHASERKA